MSIVSRTFAEVGNAIKDAFGHVVHGDDAGTYETKVLVVHPTPVRERGRNTHKYDLGMTFLNVNDRAFVNTVEPESDAALASIQAQDCLQVAIVLGGSRKLEKMQNDVYRAADFGLECEKKGHRTSFDEFRALFENCSLDVDKAGIEMFDSSDSNILNTENIPISRRIRTTTQEMVGRCSGLGDANLTANIPSKSLHEAEYPVVLVFRHTHKRHVKSTPHVGMPYFRLDDECERAALIVRRLAPTIDVKADPDAWDEIMENASKYFSPREKELKLPKVQPNIDDVEVETIRGMIQNALGLAFIRTSKVVLGVSFHFGSGIVISRLEDGSWSAPSAIGMYGAGLGVQFGLEVADYIFVLQTEEALDHFRQGTNYTIGGNMGAAMGGVGREAYGAASMGTPQKHGTEDKRKVAPIVAYAKSQGLYFGVSLEGSKIFAREDINRRAYKFTTGKDFSTDDILSGRVPAPRNAEELYATLHSVEFAHEMINLPRPPQILIEDLPNDWSSDNAALSGGKGEEKRPGDLSFLSNDIEDFSDFETSFKSFLYGGVSVQRISPRQLDGGGVEFLERRILWMMLPEVGSLRLGYLSKQLTESNDDHSEFSQGGTQISDDHTAGEYSADDITTDSRRSMNSAPIRKRRAGKFQLSKKHSVALTDVLSVRRISTNAGNPNDDEKELRVIQIIDKNKHNLRFIANTIREAELLICGLKLLLERETFRMRVRDGVADKLGGILPIIKNSGKSDIFSDESSDHKSDLSSDFSSSGNDSDNDSTHGDLPGGHQSWSQVPARNHLRTEASSHGTATETPAKSSEPKSRNPSVGVPSGPKYNHGDQLITEIVTDVKISLPLPLCRVLFLDSTSPLIKRWEIDRGDTNYSRTGWNFPPSSSRRKDSDLPMNELLSEGPMQSGHRTILFDRLRNGQRIRLSETLVVMMDDDEEVSLSISERMPRRGFSTKVRITLLKETKKSCSVSIFGEIVPIGKDLSNQGSVHRAFLLVVDELRGRYGTEGKGLLTGLTKIVAAFPSSNDESPQRSPQASVVNQGSSIDASNKAPIAGFSLGGWPSLNSNVLDNSSTETARTPRRVERQKDHQRPPTPSLGRNSSAQVAKNWATSDFVEWSDMPMDETPSRSNVTIDVKPLPKLRLDLMPAPLEEDEDDISSKY